MLAGQPGRLVFKRGDSDDADLRDLLACMLEKSPERRATLRDIKAHPWVTEGGRRPFWPGSIHLLERIVPSEDDVSKAISLLGNVVVRIHFHPLSYVLAACACLTCWIDPCVVLLTYDRNLCRM